MDRELKKQFLEYFNSYLNPQIREFSVFQGIEFKIVDITKKYIEVDINTLEKRNYTRGESENEEKQIVYSVRNAIINRIGSAFNVANFRANYTDKSRLVHNKKYTSSFIKFPIEKGNYVPSISTIDYSDKAIFLSALTELNLDSFFN